MLYQKLLATVCKHKMLDSNAANFIVLGLSGGADSMCLLHCLMELGHRYNLRIHAVHINHGIRGGDADEDAAFVESYCKRINIPVTVYKVNIPEIAKKRKITIEEAGRAERQRLFHEVLEREGPGRIALAHHMDDNAETIIMRLGRGTGLRGLAGIPPVRGVIIRPLIEARRHEIYAYVSEHAIPYRHDASNSEEIYLRNRIRLNVIPEMERAMGNGLAESLARLSVAAAEENEYLERIAEDIYNKCIVKSEGGVTELSISGLCQHPPVMLRRVFRHALRDFLKDLTYAHTDRILDLLNGGTGRRISLNAGLTAERSYDRLIFSYAVIAGTETPRSYTLELDGQIYVQEIRISLTLSKQPISELQNYNNICTKKFCYDKMSNAIEIRTRRPGDVITLHNAGTQKLSDYFINNKYPRELRDRIYLAAAGERILWIMDGRNTENAKYAATGEGQAVYLQSWEDKK